ncbi:transient-receptor-potential-like protein isoform X1 [Anneissia japonica]|uniref:transient-receptor-potential-like protein isoform X1 n=1 Tax=Anneissia japonica TaxID=1529436 RepID=UPI001425B533|nr:transient-receptor-potential-like protein isoform X1 [Anneissia japonica]
MYLQENADVEWKFSRTAAWMTYMTFDIELPPPFNLLPSVRKCCRNEDAVEKSPVRVDYFKRQYKRVIGTLVERFIHESNIEESSAEANISKKDITSLKTDILTLRYDCGEMLKGLNKSLNSALSFTDLTNKKLEVTHTIDENVLVCQNEIKVQQERYQRIQANLHEISETTLASMPPQPPPMRSQRSGTKVADMASMFKAAQISGSRLNDQAKVLFNANE